jgi:SAM-dependent methyltransferase
MTAPAAGAARLSEILAPGAGERAEPSVDGYIDLLGPEPPASTGRVQDLMLSGLLPKVYERWWRPALGRAFKGVLGPSMAGERRIAMSMLELAPGERALDVACGTGAFTRDFAGAVGREGLAVGIDVSATMLARAVRATPGAAFPQAAYVRGDAQEPPFRDHSFHGICCFAALHLFGDPLRALDRMTASLVPGGRIAIFTSARGRSTPLRTLESIASRQTGMRLFERREVIDALAERGFGGFEQRVTGFTQFVGARLAGV